MKDLGTIVRENTLARLEYMKGEKARNAAAVAAASKALSTVVCNCKGDGCKRKSKLYFKA